MILQTQLNKEILIRSIATHNKYMQIKERNAISNEVTLPKYVLMFIHIFETSDPMMILQ